MKTYPPDSVFVTGVARVSKEDAINAMYGTFTLSLVVDVKTGTIINCSANMIMSDTIDFLRQIIEGKNLVTDTDLITDPATTERRSIKVRLLPVPISF